MENNQKKKMLLILIAVIGLLLSLAIYLAFFQMFKSSFYAGHELNARNSKDESEVLRGSILDRNGKVLTYTVRDGEGKSQRINNFDRLYTPVIGYKSSRYGKSGLESKYNKELLNVASNEDFLDKLKETYKKKKKGKDVVLTIDHDLQSYVYDALGDKKGAAIVIDPKTGEILAMVSKPTFNVNKVDQNWEALINDKNGIMINRATQGLYPPGSIFKIISSIAILEGDIDQAYEDKGSNTIDGFKINNFNNKAYGDLNLETALIHSSNAYFSEKSKLISTEKYLDITKRMHIGSSINFDLGTNVSKMVYNSKISTLEKAVAAFGQGDNLVTPLDMAMMISSIANDGVLMKPHLVAEVQEENITIDKKPENLGRVTSVEVAKQLGQYLRSTAKYNGYTIANYAIAGKTGTAENTSGPAHSWYVGYGPIEDPRYAVVVLLENNGTKKPNAGSKYVQIMNYLLNYR